ncbi:TonB-dependent receptor domain-containing protein [Chryseobacterium foetidum]|uniref:TonB-dependent receptor domain-containing protein n=1 Tax=Chryseobacterium foetidum TaxID=2951057 RepID=UPI0021CA020C|nr:TonB-dependent receptor [Chryseobacterium foetidum]
MQRFFVLLMMLCESFIFSQTVEGNVILKDKKPVSYAEIILKKNQLKFSAITDEKGHFKIQVKEKGDYNFEIFNEGELVLSEVLKIEDDVFKNFEIDNNQNKSKIQEKKIEGVVVTAKNKIIERRVDRLVFNVENSIASQGLDAVEALAKTPMLRATDKSISIAGKSGVAVMINDRLLNISGEELINYLKNLRSDDIQKIEVITTPPAKYEAQGKSGLINIVLKKNTGLGWNVSLQSSLKNLYWNVPSVSTRYGATLNYQGKKLSASAGFTDGNFYWRMKGYEYSSGNDSYWNTDSYFFNNLRNKSTNLKLEYKLSDKSTIGGSYNYFFANPVETVKNTSAIKDEAGERSFSSDALAFNHRNNHYATLFYDVKIDSLGSKLSVSGNLISNNANADDYYNTQTDQLISTYINPINQYRIYSGQADLEKNFRKFKTESGLKFTKIKNDSFFNYYDLNNGIPTMNFNQSNNFFYDENNYAAYISGNYEISDKWSAKAGLRYEFTELTGISPNENLTTKNHYGKFFPTAYISYKPNENNAFSINYSKRINRPSFRDLNPFRYISSAFEYSSGNPLLRPSFTDNVEFSYVLKNNFTLTAFHNYSKNDWDRLQRINDGLKYTIIFNFYNQNQTGISLSYNYTKKSWLESNIFVNAYYVTSKTFVEDAVQMPGSYGSDFNFDNTFFLNKSKTVSFMLGAWGNIPYKEGNTSFKGVTSVYSGLKLNLMDKKLTMNLLMNDVLNTEREKGTEFYQDFSTQYYFKGISRNLSLSVTYKFGNNDVKGATKELKFDDQNRAK